MARKPKPEHAALTKVATTASLAINRSRELAFMLPKLEEANALLQKRYDLRVCATKGNREHHPTRKLMAAADDFCDRMRALAAPLTKAIAELEKVVAEAKEDQSHNLRS